MRTVVEYSNTTTETPHAFAPSITTSCCLELIRTEEADKGKCILNQDQLYFWTLVFQENSDQQVTIHSVGGDDKVRSVKVTCPHLFIDLGFGNIIYLLEGDLLGIRSIQHLYEYKVVRVDNYKERSSITTNDDFEVDGVAEKMAETTGLCGGRRHISDLDLLNPKTGFSTKWMSDHSAYDSQATVSDDEGNYTDNLETGNVRAINIKED